MMKNSEQAKINAAHYIQGFLMTNKERFVRQLNEDKEIITPEALWETMRGLEALMSQGRAGCK
jgi:hypothetical protein